MVLLSTKKYVETGVLLKDHKAVTPVRLEPAAPRSRVKHFVTFPCGVFGQVLYLIVLIPDLCLLTFKNIKCYTAVI